MSQIPEYDLHLFGQGRHWHIYRWLGAHLQQDGARFAVWAPNAAEVSVVGDFNGWNVHANRMHCRSEVWETQVPGVGPRALYKFALRGADGHWHLKSDPYGRSFEFRPQTASRVAPEPDHRWRDAGWVTQREHFDWQHAPMSIYEVHLGSWQCRPDGGWYGYRELAHRLVDYVARLGYTHIELMPVMEYPYDGSWGYQAVGLYAPTARFGNADDFRYFVDHCHLNGIGVLLDWVPAHFPKDAHGLARFDGTTLYEHPDPLQAEHPDWGTLVFDYGRPQVKNYLLANALYWLEEFHVDGLRVDAVSSMIRLDYSRPAGRWTPNRYGGPENLEAIAFLQELNEVVHARHPGAVVIAEESTAWPKVSRPVYLGGLGFSMKWNMGWMHDTLDYFAKDPIYRSYHHDKLSFGISYTWNENFVLPLSHDEVVHGKSPLLYKMPGDEWQKFANLRLLFAYQWTYPGKKLLFMGGEIGETREWTHERALNWQLLDYAHHAGVQRWVADLNRVYREYPALHRDDFNPWGFQWCDVHDAAHSTLSFLRLAGDEVVVVVLNFTPQPRPDFRVGVPKAGRYRELLNSDASDYGGSGMGNGGSAQAVEQAYMGKPCMLTLQLPPLAALILAPAGTH